MNYIKHLTEAFKMLDAEDQIKPIHIAVYMALFRHWNRNRFKNPIGIIREDIMEKSKIYSITTYYKSIKDLQKLGFLSYKPSYNPYTGTSILMTVFTNNAIANRELIQKQQKKNLSQSKNDVLTKEVYISNNINNKNNNIYIPKIKNEKDVLVKKNPTTRPKFEVPTIQKVKFFFEEVNSTKNEAERFYNYYSSNGWLVGGKTQMKDWEAAARNWILNSPKFRANESNSNTPKPNNLHVKTDKNYGEPL